MTVVAFAGRFLVGVAVRVWPVGPFAVATAAVFEVATLLVVSGSPCTGVEITVSTQIRAAVRDFFTRKKIKQDEKSGLTECQLIRTSKKFAQN